MDYFKNHSFENEEFEVGFFYYGGEPFDYFDPSAPLGTGFAQYKFAQGKQQRTQADKSAEDRAVFISGAEDCLAQP